MKPRIIVLTPAIANLERSLAFHRDGLGQPTGDIAGCEFEHGAVAFFDLAGAPSSPSGRRRTARMFRWYDRLDDLGDTGTIVVFGGFSCHRYRR